MRLHQAFDRDSRAVPTGSPPRLRGGVGAERPALHFEGTFHYPFFLIGGAFPASASGFFSSSLVSWGMYVLNGLVSPRSSLLAGTPCWLSGSGGTTVLRRPFSSSSLSRTRYS